MLILPVSTWAVNLEDKVVKVADGDTITIRDVIRPSRCSPHESIGFGVVMILDKSFNLYAHSN
jgi:hypothetical protein